MVTSFQKLLVSLFALPVALMSQQALAGDTPCGKFDFSNGMFNCKIEVSGGCEVDCTPLKFEAGCDGHCNAQVNTVCTGDCETTCITQCDPAHLDCDAGCHTECDQPCVTQCKKDHPGADCVTECKGSCDMHCRAACGVTPSDCLSHCKECCHGACSTTANFDCDVSCFAELQGGCTAQCSEPTGALFCNGEYVYASDIEACIQYLATQGINVDISARASATCTLSGCDGVSSIKGCSASPIQSMPLDMTGLAVGVAVVGIAVSRRRNKK
jgi:hypothetical protein